MTEKELFISWLNDAYSTELAMMPVLENHANDARDYPEIYQHNMRHLVETRRQAERLETMIKNLGGKVSTVKSITGKTLGLGKSVSTGIFSDEMIKNFLADYAAEHLEIASYKSLIATARHIGEHQCIPVLEEILAEEVAMAAWLKERIPMATTESIKFVTSEEGGKRSKKSGRTKSVATGLFKPSVLVTLLGVGAIGAGATMILRSSKNKNNGENNHHSLKGADTFASNQMNERDKLEQVDLVVTETLIVEEEPGLEISRASGGAGF
jgi:ferritin-like metal-binding protein YciE